MKSIKFFLLSFVIIIIAVSLFAQKNHTSSALKISNKPTIVFVHGLWADGSCWNTVTTTLQKEGYEVIAVQNPTTSLEEDVAATKRALDQTTGPVILVGHSWGGFVITEAGTDPRVTALVYVAALVPDANQTTVDILAMAAPNQLSSYFKVTDGFITLSKEGITKAFAADLPPSQQLQVYATQTPAAQTVFGAKCTLPAWKSKPSWYVVGKNDEAINPDLQRLLAKKINATTYESASSHVVMLARPQDVLKAIREAAVHQ